MVSISFGVDSASSHADSVLNPTEIAAAGPVETPSTSHPAADGPEPAVVCRAEPPFNVVYANPAWESLCGWSSHEMLGRDLKCLQGPATDKHAIEQLMDSVRKQEPCVLPSLVNYDRQKRPFCHHVTITPLAAPDGRVGLFRATSRSVSLLHSASRGNQTPAASLDIERLGGLDAAAAAVGSVDLTFSTLVAAANHKRAREPSEAERLYALLNSPPIHRSPSSSRGSMGFQPASGLAPSSMVVLTAAEPPYAILWASAGWTAICGFSLVEIVGNDLSCIQGPATDKSVIKGLMSHIKNREACTVQLINYDKRRRPFQHTLTVKPVAAVGGAPSLEEAREGKLFRDSAASGEGGEVVSMFRAESTDVRVSCGGCFEPLAEAQNFLDPLEEETDFWGEEFEDFQHSMGSFAEALDKAAAKLKL